MVANYYLPDKGPGKDVTGPRPQMQVACYGAPAYCQPLVAPQVPVFLK